MDSSGAASSAADVFAVILIEDRRNHVFSEAIWLGYWGDDAGRSDDDFVMVDSAHPSSRLGLHISAPETPDALFAFILFDKTINKKTALR